MGRFICIVILSIFCGAISVVPADGMLNSMHADAPHADAPHAAAPHAAGNARTAVGSDYDRIDLQAKVTPPDSVRLPARIAKDWKWVIIHRRPDPMDTSVHYTRFIDFCLRAYRWAKINFDSYDTTYVVGTGKHGKVRIVSDNWTDGYYFKSHKGDPMIMVSSPYYNIGFQTNYSSLSISYSVEVKSMSFHKKTDHKKMGLSFTCARLFGDAYYWRNSGGTAIRRVGNNVDSKGLVFDGMKFKAYGVMGYYIFNYRKFSLASAYNLSNYQVKSMGSWMAGMTGTFYDTEFDFSRLPENILEQTQLPKEIYRLHYNSVNLSGGYSYNWVINKHLLFNVTTLPAVGLSFSFNNSTEGRKILFSNNIRQMLSLTYTNRQFFLNGTANFHGNLFLTRDIGFMSGIGNIQMSTGVRF